MVRFNDLMQTVLAAEGRSGLGAVTLWRQCVDLLAQNDRHDRPIMSDAERAALLERLSGLLPKLSETQRIATVVELGGRLRSPRLVEFFANDRPAIAAAAMSRARLSDAAWVEMLPRLTPTARGVLRSRRDLGPATLQGLEAFGATDLVLTSDVVVEQEDMLLTEAMIVPADPPVDPAPAEPAEEDRSQIRNLVDRIARFTSARRAGDADEAPQRPAIAGPRAFAFETDASGTIVWIDQGPRAALIGLALNETALEGGSGPDGHVAGAFMRRSGFQNGRYTIVGGTMAGEWRLSATPFFDPRSGRFQGYRGQARRPYLHEVAAEPRAEPVSIAGLSADSIRQLVHELRTPLNAILGFAEIIEQELFGPAGPEYRDMAGKIAVDARHLLTAFDDLDLAARVSRGEGGTEPPRAIDPALLVTQVSTRFREQGDGAQIDIAMARGLPMVRIDPVQGERMIQHLLRTLISVSPAGEALTGACWYQPDGAEGRVVLAIDRPSTLAGMEEERLLDPGYMPDGNWADGPLLGLGFSLRLIRSLATGCGGALDIEPGRFLLAVPAMAETEDAVGSA
ncbi:HAMP domain-containing histidine kinase [Sphingobium indicum]|uniref:histidine kinase n=3 Tax=Sphingobium indicum TaxID=332055 RepID=A0A1L5BN26_SPHIB|nr:HAMP domain-containing sensor histidine kinase [Sphingobium indicum]APL94177.1 histidine kinase [Sphingobium indicum B90A]RYM03915.1 HAMP domain-containing histidine kinase [Sphingobium indicum]